MTLDDLHALTMDQTTVPMDPTGSDDLEYADVAATHSLISCSNLCA